METKNLLLILALIVIIGLVIGGLILYANYHRMSEELKKKPFPVEKHETITGKPGEGLSVNAKCPTGTKAISGGCTVHSEGVRVEDSQLIKTNMNFDYYNAWQCGYGFLKEGSHAVTATVNCK